MNVDVVYLRDATVGGDAKAKGLKETMDVADAAPLAARQVISVSTTSQNVELAHEVAKLIPAERRAVVSLAITPSTLAITVGDADLAVVVTATYDDESTKVVTADAVITSDAPSKATIVAQKIHAVAAGTSDITVTYKGKTATKTVTVSGA